MSLHPSFRLKTIWTTQPRCEVGILSRLFGMCCACIRLFYLASSGHVGNVLYYSLVEQYWCLVGGALPAPIENAGPEPLLQLMT